MNRKFKSAYEAVFKAFIELITFGDSLEFSFDTITTDNEEINFALEKVFPNSQSILCYFHYKQLLVRNATRMGLYAIKYANDTNIIINELGLLQLKYSGKIDYITNKIKNLQNTFKDHYAFLEYFVTEKLKYFLNNSLYYNIYPKYVRSNSILENYNMYMNNILGNKQLIEYITILNFIKKEDERFFKEFNLKSRNYNEIIKFKKRYKHNDDKNKILNFNIIEENRMLGKKWLQNSNNSCRFDVFYTVYLLTLYHYVKDNFNNINLYEGISILHKTINSLLNKIKPFSFLGWKGLIF